MDCKELGAAAHDYFTKSLDEATRCAFEQHEQTCPRCADFMRVAREITCQEMMEFLYQYVENELDADRRAIFDRHLRICPDCARFLASYRQTIRLSREVIRVEEAGLPPELPEQLVYAILKAIPKEK